jgi:molecular chaperone GrpE (heat shock protein)
MKKRRWWREKFWRITIPFFALIMGLFLGFLMFSGGDKVNPAAAEQASSQIDILGIVLLVLLLAALIGHSFLLYKQYRKQKNSKTVSEDSDRSDEQVQPMVEVLRKVDGMIDTLLNFQRLLDEKDEELSRYKENYDARVLETALKKISRIYLYLEEILEDHKTHKEMPIYQELEGVLEIYRDALDEFGVKEFVPVVGDDFRLVEGLDMSPRKVAAEDPSMNFKIKEIIQKGFKMQVPDGLKELVPAKVSIYITQ